MYGDAKKGFMANENDLAKPHSPYGNIKLQLENHLAEITQGTNTQHISLRISNAYGQVNQQD